MGGKQSGSLLSISLSGRGQAGSRAIIHCPPVTQTAASVRNTRERGRVIRRSLEDAAALCVMSVTPDAYWLALRRVHGAGPRTCRLLLERFGSAEQIFKAAEEEIVAAGVGRNVARAFASFNDFCAAGKGTLRIAAARRADGAMD